MGGELLLTSERPFITKGVHKRAHIVDLQHVNLLPGERVMRVAFKNVFQVRTFSSWGPVLWWYDEISGEPRPGYYQQLNGVYVVGCFYSDCSHGIDIASHFFVRKLNGLRGGLMDWKYDFDFPPGVQKYSVCAVTPDDYAWEADAYCDPYNHAVSTVNWSRMAELGVDMTTLIDYMSSPQYQCDENFRPIGQT